MCRPSLKYSTDPTKNKEMNSNEVQKVSTFRRVLPQILATSAKNLIVFNLGQFVAFPSIVIPSLVGMSQALNPDETVHLTAAQSSWLSSFAHIAHPIGSMISGLICDKFGRRRTIMFVTIPIFIAWIMLGFAQSFAMICFGFILIGFCMGLKEGPSITYVSEISESAFRGMITTVTISSNNLGTFVVMGLGTILSWRQVSFICAIFPVCCFIAVLFIPESPFWLFAKQRPGDAKKALQWLRGWVTPQTIHKEYTKLENFSNIAFVCTPCAKESIECNHSKPTFWNQLKELKRKRNIKAFVLCANLYFLNQFGLITVWQPYIIQVLNALGTPINASFVTVMNATFGVTAGFALMLTIKRLGRRKIYLTSIMIVAICSFALSVYGFIFLPSGWTSFESTPSNHANIHENIGNYSYVALFLILVMHFTTRFAIFGMQNLFASEVYPFKSRAFLCGISTALNYVFAAISTKVYYSVETWLSLPGACLFYGIISFCGFFVMFFIMPETEQRSLEDIELHYSDNSKGITDIDICRNAISISECKA